MNGNTEPSTPAPSLGQAIGSALAAAFGVQSRKNRERDFGRGSPIKLIVAGLGVTSGLVLAIWLAVRLALRHAGM